MEIYHDIYDRIAKRCISLSDRGTINLINGLYGTIILRMVEYGFYHAIRSLDMDTIYFPEPLVIYLYNRENMPDEYSLRIKLGTQGEFIYTVPVYKYLEKTMEELNDKKLIVLLPFQLLRLRREIAKERTKENMLALKHLLRMI